jgi:hypothetical protein
VLLDRGFERLHVTIKAGLDQVRVLRQVVGLKELLARELSSKHLDWDQETQDPLLILKIVFYRHLESAPQFLPSFFEVAIVHVVAAMVVGYLHLPGFRKNT